jgi:hypothetical protein
MGVDELIARAAIHDVVLRYCRGIDRLDRDLVRSCYHADATDEHGSFSGGVEAYLDWVFRLVPKYDATQHLVANHLAEFGAGGAAAGVAVAETYGVSVHVTAGGPPTRNLIVGFRFVDRFEDRGDGWRIAARYATTEWTRAPDPATHWPTPEHLRTGRRDRNDVLYTLLADL